MILEFTPEAFTKMRSLVDACEDEIQGLGKVQLNGQDRVLVTDIVTFKQRVSGASTEVDKDGMMTFLEGRVKKGDSADWKLWWHSHAGMGVFFSGTDTTFIDDTAAETADWLISLVTNHEGEIKIQLNTYRPFKLKLEDIPYQVTVPNSREIRDWAKKEVADKVSTFYTKVETDWDRKEKDKRSTGFDTEKKDSDDGFWDKEITRVENKIIMGEDLSAWEISMAKQYGLFDSLEGGYNG